MSSDISIGFSSYSFHQRLSTGAMTLEDVIDWVAASAGEHLELAVLSDAADSPIPSLGWSDERLAALRAKAEAAGVPLSSLAVGADLSTGDAAQVERVQRYVDLAATLGITRMRHDVVPHGVVEGDDTVQFERVLPHIVAGAQEIAQYAAAKGITTSLENHGFFVQSADRVRRIIHAVGEPNFRTTLDVGNFVCVDADPIASVQENLPYAMTVHLKDFYIRPADAPVGAGWFSSRAGRKLRGAVLGCGDLDLRSIARAIRDAGFSGPVTIEFEGWEDCLLACERSLAAATDLLERN